MDASSISDQEVGNRANLALIAEALSIRIALPRATLPCPTQPSAICWGWAFDEREIRVAAATITDAAEACFGERPFGLIGFSNGGYLLSKLFRTCRVEEELPGVSWMVTVGSAALNGEMGPQPASLRGCGRMVILTGVDDTYNFDPADRFLHALEGKGADVRGRRFDGGHVVPDAPLRSVLEELLSGASVPASR